VLAELDADENDKLKMYHSNDHRISKKRKLNPEMATYYIF
jgi:hypothetical protein